MLSSLAVAQMAENYSDGHFKQIFSIFLFCFFVCFFLPKIDTQFQTSRLKAILLSFLVIFVKADFFFSNAPMSNTCNVEDSTEDFFSRDPFFSQWSSVRNVLFVTNNFKILQKQ